MIPEMVDMERSEKFEGIGLASEENMTQEMDQVMKNATCVLYYPVSVRCPDLGAAHMYMCFVLSKMYIYAHHFFQSPSLTLYT